MPWLSAAAGRRRTRRYLAPVEPTYVRRRPARRAVLRRRARFQLLRVGGPPVEMWLWDLDQILDARRRPADFWAVVEAAELAFSEGDSSWIEFPSGRRVPDGNRS